MINPFHSSLSAPLATCLCALIHSYHSTSRSQLPSPPVSFRTYSIPSGRADYGLNSRTLPSTASDTSTSTYGSPIGMSVTVRAQLRWRFLTMTSHKFRVMRIVNESFSAESHCQCCPSQDHITVGRFSRRLVRELIILAETICELGRVELYSASQSLWTKPSYGNWMQPRNRRNSRTCPSVSSQMLTLLHCLWLLA